ncbi:MAG: translocation/assembly module TamB domain-containing protein [Deltaproteobacteria bacterium]|nr:translocation/assembly module TamB domain-containing protein [Deltaproteobacteria bacterium]
MASSSFPGVLERRSHPELDWGRPSSASRPSRPSERPSRPSGGGGPPRRRGVARFALGLAAGLGLSVVFVGSLAFALLLHVDAPAARREIARLVSDGISSGMRGRFEVVDIDRISLLGGGIDVGKLTLRDPAGRDVGAAYGVHGRFDVLDLGKAFLSKTGATPTIDRVVVDRLDVALIPNAEGVPTLADAFAAKDPKPTKGPAETKPRTFRLAIADIDVRSAAAFGTVGGKRIDAHAEVTHGALRFSPEATWIAVPHLVLDVAPIEDTLPTAARAIVSARLRVPTWPDPADLPVIVDDARAEVTGGGARVGLRGRTDARGWSAQIEMPAIEPGALGRLLGARPPVHAPVAARLDAAGTLQDAEVHGAIAVGDGAAAIDGRVDFGALGSEASPALPAIGLGAATVAIRGVDPRALVPEAPALGVSADVHVDATRTMRGVELAAVTRGGASVAGRSATLDLHARAVIGPSGAIDAEGTAHVAHGRSTADATFAIASREGGGTAHAAVDAQVPALEELRGVTGQPLSGRIDLQASADVDLGAGTVSGSAAARGIGVEHPSFAVPEGAVALRAEGAIASPAFAGAVEAREIGVGHRRFRDVDVRVTGTSALIAAEGKLTTDAAQRITVSTHVRPTPAGAQITGTHATLRRDDFSADLNVQQVTLDRGTLKVEGMRLASTAGGLRLDLAFDPVRHRMTVDAASTPLDLAALAHGAAIDAKGLRGSLEVHAKLATIDVDRAKLVAGNEAGILGVDPDGPPKKAIAPKALAGLPRAGSVPYVTGHLKVDLSGATLPDVGDVEAHVDVEVEDRLVSGDVAVALRDVARVALHGAALVPGRLDDARAWSHAAGHVDLDIPQIDLQQVSAFLARRAKPGESPPQLVGLLDVTGRLERRDPHGPPTGAIELATKGLGLVSGATRVEGIDLRAKLTLDGDGDAKGEDGPARPDLPLQAAAVVEVHDGKGPLAIAHLGTEATWERLKPANLSLPDLPLSLDLLVPARELDAWPRAIASKIPLHGSFGLSARGEGTFGDPKIELRAGVDSLTAHDGSQHDAQVTLTYDGARAALKSTVRARRDRSATQAASPEADELALDGELTLRARDLFEGVAAPPWTAKLDAKLDGVPLDLVITEHGVTGAARGELHLDHLHDPAAAPATPPLSLEGRIDVDRFAVGDARFDETFLTVKVDDRAATATVALHGKDGRLDAKANVPLVWASTLPSIAPGAPVEASLDMKDLRLKIVEPFVTAVDALDGKLDAHFSARMQKDASGRWTGAPEGTLKLRDGVIVADAVGERWERVAAEVKVQNGRLDLSGLELRGIGAGRARIEGSAQLEGFVPKSFHLSIDTKRFPFALEGAKVGDVSGDIVIDGNLVPHGGGDGRDRFDVAVKLDGVALDLSKEAGKEVQSLDDDPSILVAQPIAEPVEPPAPGQGTPIKVTVNIPQPVWVRRDDLRVAVSGNPQITVDGPAKFAGEIRVEANPGSQLQQRSWVEVLGKRFYVQQSRVAFTGEAQFDPVLDVEVRWQAPDRTIVQIKVTGHLAAPKVTFKGLDESGGSLGLTQGEVMSLLVLGRRDAGSARQQQQAEKGAAAQAGALVQGMTGSIVGRQLQKMLPTSMNLSFGAGRYAGGYQHDNVYFEVAYSATGSRMGPQFIGQSIPKTTFLVDWRFARMWSLITTIGDTGSTLVDLLWHHRY